MRRVLLVEDDPTLGASLSERLALDYAVTWTKSVKETEAALKLVDAEIAPFFRDIASRLRDAHLVIGRSGSGSVCEFAVAGKPAILVPLAIAIDDDQGQNAKLLADAGGAEVAREAQLTVESLAKALTVLLNNPERLARMAAASRSVAIPDAAERLADVVEKTAAGG